MVTLTQRSGRLTRVLSCCLTCLTMWTVSASSAYAQSSPDAERTCLTTKEAQTLIDLECKDASAKAAQYQRLRELLDVVRRERDETTGALNEYRKVDAARIQALQEVATMSQQRNDDAVWVYVALSAMAVGVAASTGALTCVLADGCTSQVAYSMLGVGAVSTIGSLALVLWRF